jgi:hypothetical protein
VDLAPLVQEAEPPAQLAEDLAHPGLVDGPGRSRRARRHRAHRHAHRLHPGLATVVPHRRQGFRGDRPFTADVVDDVDTIDQLHGEEPPVAVGVQVPQAYQVVVAQVGHGAKLALEAQHQLGRQEGEDLQGQPGPRALVHGLVDHAHPPPTEQPAELEPIRAGKLRRRYPRHVAHVGAKDAKPRDSSRSQPSGGLYLRTGSGCADLRNRAQLRIPPEGG